MKKLHNKKLYYEVTRKVEQIVPCNFGLVCKENKSLNEYYPDGEIEKSEKVGLVTIKLAELFNVALVDVLNKHGINAKVKCNNKGDLTINNEPWELKTTQGKNFQGSTHASNKCNNYILIKYKLDYDKKLDNSNKGLIKELFVCVFEGLNNSWWKGTASHNNSRTTLKIPISEWNNYNNYVIVGSLNNLNRRNLKYCRSLRETI